MILRVAFVVLTFFGGVGLLLYVALLAAPPGRRPATGRRSSSTAAAGPSPSCIVGILALVLLFSHGWWGGGGGFFFVSLVVVAAAAVISTQLPHRGDPSHVQQGEPAPGTTDPSGATSATDTAVYPASSPATYAVPEQPRPPNPRKKGPILFWFALAVMAVALGVLGIADLAGADVAPSAYPATVLGLSAAFLLLGTFFGRAGGIILVGLVAAAVTVGTTVADKWDPHSTTVVPTSAAAGAAGVHDGRRRDPGRPDRRPRPRRPSTGAPST